MLYLAMVDNDADRFNLSMIYDEYKNYMLKYALYITRNKEHAEDAVHDAFLSIIKHKDRLFRFTKNELRNQVIIITKNKCIDLLRKKGYSNEDSIEDIENIVKTDDRLIEDQIILADEYETVRKYVASLDESSKLILEMKYVLGMTYKEIGVELGMTAKHVDTKIMRAKAKVRKLMVMGGVSDD
ncbi:MAG: sigma-70 family RNA polymerase sigma factor [Oscillospiraceae bacterium]|jgi:RNA polymerase sigma-70 factor (ECF subfamily)|nr:sigma-70 family RNA polymerase sigma factor [Oscillospiraceae bacterium]